MYVARYFGGTLAFALVVFAGCAGNQAGESEGLASPSVVSQSPTETSTTSTAAEASATSSATARSASQADLTISWAIPFTITSPSDWAQGEATTENAVEIVAGTGLRTVLAVFRKSPDTPDERVERLTTAGALDATEPTPVELDGASGHVFDVRLSDAAAGCSAGGSSLGGRCYTIHGPEGEWVWVIEEGRPSRMWVLEVNGDTVVMSSDAREDRFEEWVPTMERVVATIQWPDP